MPKIPTSSNEFITTVKNLLNNPIDLAFESLGADKITVSFLTSFTDKKDIQTNFLAPLNQLLTNNPKCNWEKILPAISQEGLRSRESMEEVVSDLLNGFTVVHLKGSKLAYSFDTHQVVKRTPTEPLIERTIRGPKLSFLEEIDKNILMIREGRKLQYGGTV